jgi:hypothetical protein
MNRRKTFVVILGVVSAFLTILPISRADEADQATRITLNQPVQIPGQVLSAGTYWFVLLDQGENLNVVEILDSDRTKPIAIVPTVTTERGKPSDKAVFTLAERPSNEPEALLTWFYPGPDGWSRVRILQTRTELTDAVQAGHCACRRIGKKRSQPSPPIENSQQDRNRCSAW